MNLNIVKYLSIIWMYVNIIMWIWILYEFESYMNFNPIWIRVMYEFKFEIFKYSCNLYLLNGVRWITLADTIDQSLVWTDFS
jgi:hypothetical protein